MRCHIFLLHLKIISIVLGGSKILISHLQILFLVRDSESLIKSSEVLSDNL
jgi:hypothetical protein